MRSTVNSAPDWTSEGAFTIEYEGGVGVAVGPAVGVAVGVPVGPAVGVAVGVAVDVGIGPAWATAGQTVMESATITRDPMTERRIVALDMVLLLVCEA
jgi:hypothetical protein